MICRRSHRHVKILFENANVGSISCSLFIVLIWHLWWNRGQVLHFLLQVKTYMYVAHLWSPKPTNYSTWTDKKGVKNVKKSNGMSSSNERKKKYTLQRFPRGGSLTWEMIGKTTQFHGTLHFFYIMQIESI